MFADMKFYFRPLGNGAPDPPPRVDLGFWRESTLLDSLLSSPPLLSFGGGILAQMQNYAPRVSLPWSDLSGVATLWANYCDRFIAYEHEADAKVSRTHCHFLMIDCKVKEEAFKRMSKLPGRGNEFWKWATKETPDESFITYLSKGKLREKFKKNFSDQIVEERRGLWVEHEPSKKPVSLKKVKEEKGSHWELIMKIWNEIKENPRIVRQVVDREGAIAHEIHNHSLAFDIMNKHLNENKVRTSRNELERFYVSIMRQDTYSAQSLKKSIFSNIFRGDII